MRRLPVEIYALTVCFFTVGCFSITFGIALYDLVQIAAPEFTLSAAEYQRHQSDQAFQSYIGPRQVVTVMEGKTVAEETPPASSSAEITRRRLESFRRVVDAERHSGAQSLVRVSIIMLVAALVFFLHWRLAAYARREAAGV